MARLRTSTSAFLPVCCLLHGGAALAATSASVAPAAGLGALSVKVDVASRSVHFASCAAAPCPVSEVSPSLAIPPGAPLDEARVRVEDVALAGGRHLVHVTVPLEAGAEPEARAWEALLAPGSLPLFAGVTGYSRGEPGERSGTDVRFLTGEHGATAVVGDIREDLRICGDDATLLDPRGLDPRSMVFKGATLQRLSPERRSSAVSLEATPRHAPLEAPLAPLLLATEASSSRNASGAAALTDRDMATAWSEARPGKGQGEFILARTPFDVPIVRFSVVVAPTNAPREGASPESFYLATGAGTYEVTLPEDAWSHPGQAYDVTLPVPIQTSCVALVLGDAFARGLAHPDVTVAELAAYSSFDRPGATLADVVAAMNGGGDHASAAAAILERAGPAGLQAMGAAFSSLDAAGRALAINVAASAARCDTSSTLLVPALGDADSVVRQKALTKLTEPTCGREALPALLTGLESPATRAHVAPVVALLGRGKALAPLVRVAGEGSSEERHAVRSAIAVAARDADSGVLSRLLEGEGGRSPAATLDVLRALSARLGEAQPAADAAAERLLGGSPPREVRYRLVDVLGALAVANDANAKARLQTMATLDAAPEVRARAAELGLDAADPYALIAHALSDEEPRVREAALHAVTIGKRGAAPPAIIPLLERDPWTFVRVAAAEALGSLPPSPASDRALGEALAQLSTRVKETAVLALATHGARTYAAAIQKRLEAPEEDIDVRAASARALGLLCDAKAEDLLVDLAVKGGSSPEAADVTLGLAATEALGALHPKDLAKRFAPLAAKGARPDARAAAERAMAAEGRCPLP